MDWSGRAGDWRVSWGRCFLFLGFPSCIVVWWAVIVWNDDVVLLNDDVGECDG